MSNGTLHLLATRTTFTGQLVKRTSWQNSKTQASCKLKYTAYWIVLSLWAPVDKVSYGINDELKFHKICIDCSIKEMHILKRTFAAVADGQLPSVHYIIMWAYFSLALCQLHHHVNMLLSGCVSTISSCEHTSHWLCANYIIVWACFSLAICQIHHRVSILLTGCVCQHTSSCEHTSRWLCANYIIVWTYFSLAICQIHHRVSIILTGCVPTTSSYEHRYIHTYVDINICFIIRG